MNVNEQVKLRAMTSADIAEVADLIYVSTNYWYEAQGKGAIFRGGPEATEWVCKIYEDLDPGRCVVAENTRNGRLMGSCFYHPRPTHVSLGIMNVHPNYFGYGVAGRLLKFITDFSEAEGKPTRLVSSAHNLDSFSLYTRAGFIPRAAYQDMFLKVPETGLDLSVPGLDRVRPAVAADVDAMTELEAEVAGIRRPDDYRYFIENKDRIWHVSVHETSAGEIDGFLVSVAHPGSNMLGPGIMRSEEQTLPLILSELNQHKGRCPVFLVPVDNEPLVQTLYRWGARNCEIHFCQVRGDFRPFQGISMPTFAPETG